eukprot:4996224-Heterocapsa_arctica.AAC.1
MTFTASAVLQDLPRGDCREGGRPHQVRLDLVDAPDAEPLEAPRLRTVTGTAPSPTSQPGRAGAGLASRSGFWYPDG